MSRGEIVRNKISGILEPDYPYDFEIKLAGGVIRLNLIYEPREADRIIAVEGLGKPSKIFYRCSFRKLK